MSSKKNSENFDDMSPTLKSTPHFTQTTPRHHLDSFWALLENCYFQHQPDLGKSRFLEVIILAILFSSCILLAIAFSFPHAFSNLVGFFSRLHDAHIAFYGGPHNAKCKMTLISHFAKSTLLQNGVVQNEGHFAFRMLVSLQNKYAK